MQKLDSTLYPLTYNMDLDIICPVLFNKHNIMFMAILWLHISM